MVSVLNKLSGLLVGMITFVACQTTETSPSDQVSVGLRQSARLNSDVVVRVDSIRDSRCPANVVCIWAGEAKVKMLLAKDQDSTTVRLTLAPGAKQGNTSRPDSTNVSLSNTSYKVILREVNPYPGTSDRPQIAVVQVTKV